MHGCIMGVESWADAGAGTLVSMDEFGGVVMLAFYPSLVFGVWCLDFHFLDKSSSDTSSSRCV